MRAAAVTWLATLGALAALGAAMLLWGLAPASECSTPHAIHWWLGLPAFAIFTAAGGYVAVRGHAMQRLLLLLASAAIVAGYVAILSESLPIVIRTEIDCAATRKGQAAPSLEAFAQGTLGVSRYQSARTDLDGDGTDEILLLATAPEWCGSGGCTLFVLAAGDSGLRVVSRTTITNPPIRVLPTATNGWHDLAVVVQGGGGEAQTMRLAFNGNAYPLNPTVPPAEPVSAPSGTVLIR